MMSFWLRANEWWKKVTDPFGEGGRLFNEYQAWFTKISTPTSYTIDQTLTVRFRGFGSDKDKQAAWDKDWRSKHPDWSPVSQATVSSDPIEIWVDLREIPGEGFLLPPHILGHEIIHALQIRNINIIDPDSFAKR